MEEKYKIAVIGTRKLEKKDEVIESIKKYIEKEDIHLDSVRSGNAEGTDQLANTFSDIPDIVIIHYLP
jgi:predicted Rossmann fold nucleotide-binding protein DprA/Smf involved in DNA uptake